MLVPIFGFDRNGRSGKVARFVYRIPADEPISVRRLCNQLSEIVGIEIIENVPMAAPSQDGHISAAFFNRTVALKPDRKVRKLLGHVDNEAQVIPVLRRPIDRAEMQRVIDLVIALFSEVQTAEIDGIITEEQFYVFVHTAVGLVFVPAKSSDVELQKVGFGCAGLVIQDRPCILFLFTAFPGGRYSRCIRPQFQLINVLQLGKCGLDLKQRQDS